MEIKKLLLISIGSILLIACGGGSDSDGGASGGNGFAPTVLSGIATDDVTKMPIADANIKFNMNGQLLQTKSALDGSYHLDFGSSLQNAPERIAGTISKNGYATETLFIINRKGVPIAVPVTIKPMTDVDVDVSVSGQFGGAEKIVHLGDNNFQGSTNSQLQVGSSSGLNWYARFEYVTGLQRNKYPAGVCVTFDARGIDAGDKDDYIKLGDEKSLLLSSPSDGSFGRQSHCFSKVNSGPFNDLSIVSSSGSSSDYDDFEFINVKAQFLTTLPPKTTELQAGSVRFVGGELSLNLINLWMTNVAQVVWNFGDGSPEEMADSATLVEMVKNGSLLTTHIYKTSGVKEITATLKDASGKVLAQYTVSVDIK